MRKTMTLLAAMAVGTMTAVAPAAADIQKYNFEVVGTWGFLENYKMFESKFWQERLPKASGGKLTANAKPTPSLALKATRSCRV